MPSTSSSGRNVVHGLWGGGVGPGGAGAGWWAADGRAGRRHGGADALRRQQQPAADPPPRLLTPAAGSLPPLYSSAPRQPRPARHRRRRRAPHGAVGRQRQRRVECEVDVGDAPGGIGGREAAVRGAVRKGLPGGSAAVATAPARPARRRPHLYCSNSDLGRNVSSVYLVVHVRLPRYRGCPPWWRCGPWPCGGACGTATVRGACSALRRRSSLARRPRPVPTPSASTSFCRIAGRLGHPPASGFHRAIDRPAARRTAPPRHAAAGNR
jgi:hypothetical protein